MAIKQDEIKVVVGAGVFNNNPGWIQTQEDELNLLEKLRGKKDLNTTLFQLF
ncbi:TPA: hypothetical protein QC216_005366 [Bacillus cereus]|nr:hypothetical protein [Bacillus cereus]EMA7401167.1 hypothetical protein [Bacillus cereus]HDR8123476.1 hypothetical protein [Bacillus cereus]HDR8343668.1 hypothetical protein [Bacillus cereus]HDR8354991.1 hypothetical protein [Bacillus cereus]